MTTLIPDYEVAAFLDEVAPGKTNRKIASELGVHHNTITGWKRDGMPVNYARMLLAFRIIEVGKEHALLLDQAAAKLEKSKQLAAMMEEYQL